jgi:hypothetical protein
MYHIPIIHRHLTDRGIQARPAVALDVAEATQSARRLICSLYSLPERKKLPSSKRAQQ